MCILFVSLISRSTSIDSITLVTSLTMSAFQITFAILLAFLCYDALATPISSSFHERSYVATPHNTPGRISYRPMHPAALAGYENRGTGIPSGVSDYVVHGLGGMMRLVSREYGLRQSESFYWGPGRICVAHCINKS